MSEYNDGVQARSAAEIMAAMEAPEPEPSEPQADEMPATPLDIAKRVMFVIALVVVSFGSSPVRIAALLILGADFLIAAALAGRYPRLLQWVACDSRKQAVVWGSGSLGLGLMFLAAHTF